jgi:hypothetical protein
MVPRPEQRRTPKVGAAVYFVYLSVCPRRLPDAGNGGSGCRDVDCMRVFSASSTPQIRICKENDPQLGRFVSFIDSAELH